MHIMMERNTRHYMRKSDFLECDVTHYRSVQDLVYLVGCKKTSEPKSKAAYVQGGVIYLMRVRRREIFHE